MSTKYYMTVCKCGRIHMFDCNKVMTSIFDDKDILLVCKNCCTRTLIGASKKFNDVDKKFVYGVYTYDEEDISHNLDEITKDTFDTITCSSTNTDTITYQKGISEIIFSDGIKVPMKTGNYADEFVCGYFFDNTGLSFYEVMKDSMSTKDMIEREEEWKTNSGTVDMERFIKETPEPYLTEISQSGIPAFHWEGFNADSKNPEPTEKEMFIARMRHLGWCCYQIAAGQEYNVEPNKDQLDSLLQGARYGLKKLDSTPEENHENWMHCKIEQGWKYGEIKDFEKKTHPDLVPFDQLPKIEKDKDIMDVLMNRELSKLYDMFFKEGKDDDSEN